MQNSLLTSVINVFGNLVLRQDGAAAADYETWNKSNQGSYQSLLGSISAAIQLVQKQDFPTVQLDFAFTTLKEFMPEQLSGPLLLPIVTIVCGPYNGEDPSTLLERGRQSSTLVRAAFLELKTKGDYKQLDVLELLYKDSTPHPSLNAGLVSASQFDDGYTALRRAFLQRYKGATLDRFIMALSKEYGPGYKPEVHFGRCIVFANSSGLGKSKLAGDLRKTFVHMSTCFRDEQNPRSGWPPNDPSAHEFLRSNKGRAEERFAAYLAAQIQEIEGILDKNGVHGQEALNALNLHFDFPTSWNDPSSSREQHFLHITQQANALLSEHSDELNSAFEDSQKEYVEDTNDNKGPQNVKKGKNRKPVMMWTRSWVWTVYKILVKSHRKKLAETMERLNIKEKSVILVFDECRALETASVDAENPYPRSDMRLISLMRVFKAADEFETDGLRIFALLLDTSSSIFELAPRGPKAPSNRLRDPFIHLPIWHYFGFHEDVTKYEDYKTLVPLIDAAKYGRVYWSTLAEEDMIPSARKKLFGGSAFKPSNKDHVLAAFSHRILLDLPTGPTASSLVAINAVKRHMRLIQKVTEDIVISTAASEPILSLAAAQALTELEETYDTAIHTLAHQLILNSAIDDRGQRGELITRLLLTMARDHATEGAFGNKAFTSHTEREKTIQTVTFSSLLRNMLGDGLAKGSNETVVEKLLKWGEDVHLNFTHFIQANTSIDSVSESTLAELWHLSAAVQCVFNQTIMDGFLVGYKGRIDLPFNPEKLIIIPWQTKAQMKASSKATAAGLTSPTIIRPEKTASTKPMHAVLFFDLTTTANFAESKGPILITHSSAVRQPNAVWAGYLTEEPQRFCINIRGHGKKVYTHLQRGKLDASFSKLFDRALFSGPHGDTMEETADTWEEKVSNLRLL